MASGGSFGGARGYQPRPPEKGVFPLDHFGECKHVKEDYMKCLKEHAGDASACTDLARRYLECRMEKNLMAQQDLKELGFLSNQRLEKEHESSPSSAKESDRQRKERGFVAGLAKFEKSS